MIRPLNIYRQVKGQITKKSIHLLAFPLPEALWLKPKNNLLFSGPPCSRARNTDTFQVVVYEAQFFSQCVMGRFLFLTHNERHAACNKVEIARQSMLYTR